MSAPFTYKASVVYGDRQCLLKMSTNLRNIDCERIFFNLGCMINYYISSTGALSQYCLPQLVCSWIVTFALGHTDISVESGYAA